MNVSHTPGKRPLLTPRKASFIRNGEALEYSAIGDLSMMMGERSSNPIQVFCRVRPSNDAEKDCPSCVLVEGTDTVVLSSRESRRFTFDYVASQTTQQCELFPIMGQQLTEACLDGYNGCIFAYGQTGSGKTFTMQGDMECDSDSHSEKRGLIPRILEHLFEFIERREKDSSDTKFLVKCSYLEIYNENITDLLDTTNQNLQIREQVNHGTYVENLSESVVGSAMQCHRLLQTGARNRHVGITAMNKESSRSHSVFCILVESKHVAGGLTCIRHSRLNLVDLAGSERQKLTCTAGTQLKEAGNINKSLSALGNVILALSEISQGRSRHVHYRDSKLTFLLRDSLGGNSKTAIIATISPMETSFGETLSTLKFAQRAKIIKNRAVVNEDTSGNVEVLQEEIRKLKMQLSSLRDVPMPGPKQFNDDPSCSKVAMIEDMPVALPAISAQSEGRIASLQALLAKALAAQLKAEETLKSAETRINHVLNIPGIERGKHWEESLRLQLRLKEELAAHLLSNKENVEQQHNDEIAVLLRNEVAELQWQVDNIGAHPVVRKLGAELLALKRENCARKADEEFVSGGRRKLEEYNRDLRQQVLNYTSENAQLARKIKDLEFGNISVDHGHKLSAIASPVVGSTAIGSPVSAVAMNETPKRLSAMLTPDRNKYQLDELDRWREDNALAARIQILEREVSLERETVKQLRQQQKDRETVIENQLRRWSMPSSDSPQSDARACGPHCDVPRLRSEYANVCAELESSLTTIHQLQSTINENQTLLDEYKNVNEDLKAKDDEMAQAMIEISELRLAVAKYDASEAEKDNFRAQCGELNERVEQLSITLRAMEEDIDVKTENITFQQTQIDRLTQKLKQTEEQCANEETKAAHADMQLQELRTTVMAMEKGQSEALAMEIQKREKMTLKLEEMTAELEASRKYEAAMLEDVHHLRIAHSKSEKKNQALNETVSEQHDRLCAERKKREEAEQELCTAKSEVNEIENQLDVFRQQLNQLSEAHSALLKDRESFEIAHKKRVKDVLAEASLYKRQAEAANDQCVQLSSVLQLLETRTNDALVSLGAAGSNMAQILTHMSTIESNQVTSMNEMQSTLQTCRNEVERLEHDLAMQRQEREKVEQEREKESIHGQTLRLDLENRDLQMVACLKHSLEVIAAAQSTAKNLEEKYNADSAALQESNNVLAAQMQEFERMGTEENKALREMLASVKMKCDQLEDEVKSMREEAIVAEETKEQLTQRLAEISTFLEQKSREVAELEAASQIVQKQYAVAVGSAETLQSTVELLTQQLENTTKDMMIVRESAEQKMEHSASTMKQKTVSLKRELMASQQEAQAAKQAVATAKLELDKTISELESAKATQQDLQMQIIQFEREKNDLVNTMSTAKEQRKVKEQLLAKTRKSLEEAVLVSSSPQSSSNPTTAATGLVSNGSNTRATSLSPVALNRFGMDEPLKESREEIGKLTAKMELLQSTVALMEQEIRDAKTQLNLGEEERLAMEEVIREKDKAAAELRSMMTTEASSNAKTIENNARLSEENARLCNEVNKLTKEIAKLSGHHNPAQRIQYMQAVKQECNALKDAVHKRETELTATKAELDRLHTYLQRLEATLEKTAGPETLQALRTRSKVAAANSKQSKEEQDDQQRVHLQTKLEKMIGKMQTSGFHISPEAQELMKPKPNEEDSNNISDWMDRVLDGIMLQMDSLKQQKTEIVQQAKLESIALAALANASAAVATQAIRKRSSISSGVGGSDSSRDENVLSASQQQQQQMNSINTDGIVAKRVPFAVSGTDNTIATNNAPMSPLKQQDKQSLLGSSAAGSTGKSSPSSVSILRRALNVLSPINMMKTKTIPSRREFQSIPDE